MDNVSTHMALRINNRRHGVNISSFFSVSLSSNSNNNELLRPFKLLHWNGADRATHKDQEWLWIIYSETKKRHNTWVVHVPSVSIWLSESQVEWSTCVRWWWSCWRWWWWCGSVLLCIISTGNDNVMVPLLLNMPFDLSAIIRDTFDWVDRISSRLHYTLLTRIFAPAARV